jgi:hypothetical protein
VTGDGVSSSRSSSVVRVREGVVRVVRVVRGRSRCVDVVRAAVAGASSWPAVRGSESRPISVSVKDEAAIVTPTATAMPAAATTTRSRMRRMVLRRLGRGG